LKSSCYIEAFGAFVTVASNPSVQVL
jgi:hypothetical protein